MAQAVRSRRAFVRISLLVGAALVAVGMCAFIAVLAGTHARAGDEAGASATGPSACPAFPAEGPRSIFRSDLKFVPPANGQADPQSIPPTRCGCGVKLMGRLEDNFAERFKLLEAAQKTIWIESYIFTGDEIGWKTAHILVDKMRQGVDVKLIVDAYTKFNPRDQKIFTWLTRQGIPVMGFEPVYLLGTAEHKILNVPDVNLRFHEKYWVLDQQAAFMGGTNVANEYARFGDEPKAKWRDQDVLVTGPIVADVTNAFFSNYEYFTARQAHRFPTNQTAWWAKIWQKLHRLGPVPPDPSLAPPHLPITDYTDENVPVRYIRSRPRHQEDYVYQAYLHLFRQAKKSILIESAYFVPNYALVTALTQAAARGVEVTVVTNDEKTNDVAGMQPLVRYSYLPLMDAGITIYEWQGDHPGFGSMHAKCAAIDGEVAVVGSPNLDPRSLFLNAEAMLVMDSPKTAQALTNFIYTVDLPVSRKITHDQAVYWRDPKKIKDVFKLLFGRAIEDWY